MQLLAIDIGTGTQDILLFDSERTPENWLKLVMPSPTLLIGEQIRRATAARMPLLITGVLMGGGPCAWAVEGHRRAGLCVLATPAAARTLNDDLTWVERELGIEIIPDEAGRKLISDERYAHVMFRDFDYESIRKAFAAFGVSLQPSGLALAVFDHGAAPPGISDRQFRMDYLADRLRHDQRLSTFATRASEVPETMTRLQALAETATRQSGGLPVVVMDTALAAVSGALEDPSVAAQANPLVVNVGNFHTLAFQFGERRLMRLFEHHTGLLKPETLAGWLHRLADGRISHEAVFIESGHGALVLNAEPIPLEFVAVTGPRRAMLGQAGLPTYFAVPHGDQMLAGCFGLLRACADIEPTWQEPITDALTGRADRSLW